MFLNDEGTKVLLHKYIILLYHR